MLMGEIKEYSNVIKRAVWKVRLEIGSIVSNVRTVEKENDLQMRNSSA